MSEWSRPARAVGGTVLACVALCTHASGQTTTIESLSQQGTPGNGWSQDARLSANGDVIVFASSANNLVPNDTGGTDIFLRARTNGTLQRVSTRADGTAAPGAHWHPDLSADARFIVFSSDSASLVSPPTTGRNIYLRDRDTDGNGTFDEPGTVSVELISVSSTGVRADADSSLPVISGDGRFIAFQSLATNLAPNDLNASTDVFLRDRAAGTTVRLSSTSAGASGAGLSNVANISRSGSHVIFQSNAPDLIDGDTNNTTDVFRYTIATGTLERVTESESGSQLTTGSVLGSEAIVGPCISADGRHIVFQSGATNVVPGDTNGQIDVFAKDMLTGHVERMSMRSDGSETQYPCVSPTITADGRRVIFATTDGSIVPGDSNRRQDLFLRDRDPDHDGVLDEPGAVSIRRVSLGNGGIQPTLASYGGRPCDDGNCVVFTTTAGNLVDGDTNGFTDVFFSEAPTEPVCPADIDASGAVDGDDVLTFFVAWDFGDADVNVSGATDGDDLIYFFERWDLGC